jgi:hypothetical protein
VIKTVLPFASLVSADFRHSPQTSAGVAGKGLLGGFQCADSP